MRTEEDILCFFFFQAEDGIRDGHVTGVQTCALPILTPPRHLMIPDGVDTAISPCCYRAGDEGVGIVAEHLDSRRSHSKFRRALPAVIRAIADEEGRARDLQPSDRP